MFFLLILFLIIFELYTFTTTPNSSVLISYQLDEYPQIKYCHSSMDIIDGSISSSYALLRRELDNNCTHIFGDVVIKHIYRINDQEPDLRFLSSIREVTGSILLHNTNVSVVPLGNLRVVRGNSNLVYLKLKYRIALQLSGDVHYRPNDTIVDLHNLISIVKGNLRFSKVYCSSVQNVDWNEILEDPEQQKVTWDCIPEPSKCSNKCHIRNGKRHCWGSSQEMCQLFSKCTKRMCANRCFITENGDEECCDSQCLGGCSSIKSNSCVACKGVLNGPKCLEECPQKMVFDRTVGTVVPNSEYKPVFNNICLKKCPRGLLEEEGECKTHCTLKNYERNGDKCVQCQRFCEKLCSKEDIHTPTELKFSMISLNSDQLKKLTNCTTYKGTIQIDDDSFPRNPQETHKIQLAAELLHLSRLRTIQGSLYLDLKLMPFSLESLDFLAHLETVEGLDILVPVGLGVLNSPIRYLGLRSLRRVNVRKSVVVVMNKRLCFMEPMKIARQLGNHKHMTVRLNANPATCRNESQQCDAECAPSWGCWGPGPDLCHQCRTRSLSGRCGSSCIVAPGHYQKPNSTICLRCHLQCAATCSGPAENNCIGGCRNLQENGRCVERCSRTFFLHNSSKQCLPCHKSCHPRNLTVLPVCTGPSSIPGPGGCNKCLVVEVDKENVVCTTGPLPAGFFSDNRPNNAGSKFSRFTEQFTDLIMTYRPCHPLCTRCTFFTAMRISGGGSRGAASLPVAPCWNGCLQCRGFWYNNNCVKQCPYNSTFLKMDFSNTSLGECHRCHLQCRGCHGESNMNCRRCRKFKIIDIHNSSLFTCMPQCPTSHKDVFAKDNQNVCRIVLLSKVEGAIVVVSCIFIIIFIIITGIVSKHCLKKQKKRRINKLKAKFSNANEEDSQKTKLLANMRQLPVISLNNLKFSYDHPIGSGAFGSVYRGEWRPSLQDIADNVSLKSCGNEPIEVAIKELNSSRCNNEEFMEEVKVMASVRHKHCLRLIGVCVATKSKLLVTSYLSLGSMDRYLSQQMARITAELLLLWAEQIANGMCYLECNHIIHRDLATRNVLMYSETHVQITDFGLAKISLDDEIKIVSGIVPVRWLAIEALRDGIYSHKTDVWAYAVTLWEIFTFAKTPYQNIKANEIRDEIIRGTRLSQPEICSLEIYILMVNCWSFDPAERPSFSLIWDDMKRFCKKPKAYITYPNIICQEPSTNNVQYMEMATEEILSNRSDSAMRHNTRHINNDSFNIPEVLKPLLPSPVWNGFYQPAENDSQSLFRSPCNSPSIIHVPAQFKSPSPQEELNSPSEYLEPMDNLANHER